MADQPPARPRTGCLVAAIWLIGLPMLAFLAIPLGAPHSGWAAVAGFIFVGSLFALLLATVRVTSRECPQCGHCLLWRERRERDECSCGWRRDTDTPDQHPAGQAAAAVTAATPERMPVPMVLIWLAGMVIVFGAPALAVALFADAGGWHDEHGWPDGSIQVPPAMVVGWTVLCLVGSLLGWRYPVCPRCHGYRNFMTGLHCPRCGELNCPLHGAYRWRTDVRRGVCPKCGWRAEEAGPAGG